MYNVTAFLKELAVFTPSKKVLGKVLKAPSQL